MLTIVFITASTPQPEPGKPVEVVAAMPDAPNWQDRHFPASTMMETAFLHVAHTKPAYTSGPSADVGRVTFDGPVDILGILISVDITDGVGLYEILVGKNMETWESNTVGGLFQLSYQDMGTGRLDDHIWFPEPYPLDDDDWLAVVAWMYNRTDREAIVHPEVIVYYRAQAAE